MVKLAYQKNCDTIVLREGVENMNTCKTEGCDKPVKVAKLGLCLSHSQSYYRKNSPAKRTCSVDLCDRKYYAVGICHKHYEQKRRLGYTLTEVIYENTLECTFEPCTKKRMAKGLCKSHYQQNWLGMELSVVNPRGEVTDTHKECMDCRVLKPHSEFYREKNTPSGLRSYCKVCYIDRVERNKQRRIAAGDKDE